MNLFEIVIAGLLLASLIISTAHSEPQYRKVEAENGTIYRVDLSHTWRNAQGGAVTTVLEGDDYVGDVTQFVFDCQGWFSIVDPAANIPMHHIPPRSIVANFAAIACTARP
jgi:hypothetical protein